MRTFASALLTATAAATKLKTANKAAYNYNFDY